MFLTKADVYLLDEPTNHLDFETVEAMGEALGKFNGTVLVVSHNRTFVNLIATEIIEVKAGQVKRVNGTYEDYVWLMEQEAEREQNSKSKETTPTTSSSPLERGTVDSNNSNPPSSKENARKLYELRKELQKIENKIKKLQELVDKGVDAKTNQAIIDDQEIKWLEIQAQMEGLK